MNLLLFLIVFPLLAALVLLVTKNQPLRGLIIKLSCVLICVASLALLFKNYQQNAQFFVAHFPYVDTAIFILEMLIAAYLIYLGIKSKRYLVVVLVVLQALVVLWFEFNMTHGIETANNLFIDKFSIIMALIIGIIGSLICLYSVGYMKEFHTNYYKEMSDKSPFFSFLIFLFLSAMFGVVFANNLVWLYAVFFLSDRL